MLDDFAAEPRQSFARYLSTRRQAFVAVYVAYVGCYLVRNNTKVAGDLLGQQLGWSPREIGYVLAGFTIAYGLSKVVLGVVVDRTRVRLALGSAVAISAVICLVMPLAPSIPVWVGAMALIGVVQGAAAPAALTTLGAWYPNAARASRVAVWNTSQNLGAALIPALAAGGIALTAGTWQVAFWLPAVVALLVAVWFARFGVERPWQEGLPTLRELFGAAGTPRLPQADDVSYWKLVRVHVLTSKLLLVVAAINALLYFARFGVLNWMSIYLARDKGLGMNEIATAIAVLEWGAIPGALVFALIAWRWPNRMATAGAVGVLGLAVAVLVYVGTSSVAGVLTSTAVLGALAYGPQVIVNILTLNFVSPRATGVAVGIVSLGGYLFGDLAANLVLPYVAEGSGWHTALFLVAAGCLLCVALYASLRDAERRVVYLGSEAVDA